ncbi:MAG: glycosyltransferase family 39 protein [Victivallaceae bacterium]|nr:glycosyltransferase family 39 protein [Victivallaceae bacterium]
MKDILDKTFDMANRKLDGFARWLDFCPRWLLALLVVCLYLLLRLLALPWPEYGGDAVWKWRFLKYYHETGIWFTPIRDHHMGRWAQNVPVLAAMKVFGANLFSYYLIPVLTGLGVVLGTWRIVRFFSGRFQALCAVLLTMSWIVFYDESAQFMPLLPAAMWALFGIDAMLRYIGDASKWYLPLLSGLCMGIAWGCKVTIAYWCVGIGFFLCFYPVNGRNIFKAGKFRLGFDVVLFSIAFLAVLVLETIGLNRFFDVGLGRISMLHQHSGAELVNVECQCGLAAYLFSFVLIPFRIMQKHYYYIPRICFFALTIPLFVRCLLQTGNGKPAEKFLPFIFLVSLFMHCYVVVGAFPIKYPERPLLRYYLLSMQIGFVGLAVWGPAAWRWLNGRCRWLSFAALALLVVMVVDSLIGIGVAVFDWNDNIFSVMRNVANLKEQRRENTPMLVRYYKREKRIGEDARRTRKLALSWHAFYGRTEQIPGIEEMAKRERLTDESGRFYFHVGGRAPSGKPERCLVFDESESSFENLTLK